MISHKYKCIFIHIPACAGTSMEKAIVGKNWAEIDWSTKHIKSHQAKILYSQYWKDYFKFTFVRNPWSRTVSLAKNKRHGVYVDHEIPNINFNKKRNGKWSWLEQSATFECFPMDSKLNLETKQHIENSIYLNYLLEDVDYIGKFESLVSDFEYIRSILGIKECLPKIESTQSRLKTKQKHYTEYYDEETRQIVAEKYAKDIEYFGYEFGG